jgi:hypothetical protein
MIEIIAIKEAIIYAESTFTNKILAINDSLGSLTSLLSKYATNKISQQILSTMANSKNTSYYMWVPSHIGTISNKEPTY